MAAPSGGSGVAAGGQPGDDTSSDSDPVSLGLTSTFSRDITTMITTTSIISAGLSDVTSPAADSTLTSALGGGAGIGGAQNTLPIDESTATTTTATDYRTVTQALTSTVTETVYVTIEEIDYVTEIIETIYITILPQIEYQTYTQTITTILYPTNTEGVTIGTYTKTLTQIVTVTVSPGGPSVNGAPGNNVGFVSATPTGTLAVPSSISTTSPADVSAISGSAEQSPVLVTITKTVVVTSTGVTVVLAPTNGVSATVTCENGGVYVIAPSPAPASTLTVVVTKTVTTTSVATSTSTSTTTSSCGETYTVVEGDICNAIVAKTGVTLAALYALNPVIHNPSCDNLQPGQTLCIGSSSSGSGIDAASAVSSGATSQLSGASPVLVVSDGTTTIINTFTTVYPVVVVEPIVYVIIVSVFEITDVFYINPSNGAKEQAMSTVYSTVTSSTTVTTELTSTVTVTTTVSPTASAASTPVLAPSGGSGIGAAPFSNSTMNGTTVSSGEGQGGSLLNNPTYVW